MQPRRRRDGTVFWQHEDVFLAEHGRYACRGCGEASAKPWRFYCSMACKQDFEANVPPFWSEMRSRILHRDGHRCVLCGGDGSTRSNGEARLEVDHIKPVALYPELEFEESNLRTLCHDCHAKHGAKPQSRRWRMLHDGRQQRLKVLEVER